MINQFSLKSYHEKNWYYPCLLSDQPACLHSYSPVMLNFLQVWNLITILTAAFSKIWYRSWVLLQRKSWIRLIVLNWWLLGCTGVELCKPVPVLQGSHASLWNGCIHVSPCHRFIRVRYIPVWRSPGRHTVLYSSSPWLI